MGRRHSYTNYNAPYNAPPPATWQPAPTPAVSPVRSLLSLIAPVKSSAPVHFSMPVLPTGELLGGISNTVRGLVLNDNWWIILLIIFLFFPKISNRMFGGLLKE
ncbi:MAG: hypothetical protein VB106_06585 [Clostridiaceae bacterium]|jgi:hypothetical protein|nr:hypothetical protein [Clostridiaceae bacterium]